jgi:hypothetical protein
MTRLDSGIAVVTGLATVVALIAAVGPGTFFTGVALVVGAVAILGFIGWRVANSNDESNE